MRDDLDRFYTKPEVAKECLAQVNVGFYDAVVEPSAGAGAFSSQIQDCYAFDLSPQRGDIIEKDWFDVTVNDFHDFENMLVVGNPPFGKRSTLAKQFIRHAVSLGATTIAFILPKTFSKLTNQNVFPKDWRLVKEVDLGTTDFDLFGQGELYIPCFFYVWTKHPEINHGTNLRSRKAPIPNDFRFVNRGSMEADFVINGNNGRVRDLSEVTNPKAEHYVQVADGVDVEALKAKLQQLDFTFYSSVNGGVAWVNRDDINRAYWAVECI